MTSKLGTNCKLALAGILFFSLHSVHGQFGTYTASDFAANPALIVGQGLDPFVMINLSVELTQQGEAYTDGEQVYVQNGTVCPGRTLANEGICYSPDETYIGYFDSEKCYDYATGTLADAQQNALSPELSPTINPPHFFPVGPANNHRCTALFSGNYMNWATMTALDAFRYSMTGGARILDTVGANGKTILARTMRKNAWPFVIKKITSTGSGFSVSDSNGVAHSFRNIPNQVTPFNVNTLFSDSNTPAESNTVSFTDENGNPLTYKGLSSFHVNVRVCDDGVSLESHCAPYGNGSNLWYKPEGMLQKYGQQMRFALTSYSSQALSGANGGVLRANAKYISYQRPAASGGLEVNPNAEVNDTGQFVFDPDGLAGSSGVSNSGIINYINNFGLGLNGYKQHDPIAELYYEGLRYIAGKQAPTKKYTDGLSTTDHDFFPLITAWDDPVTEYCQANFMVSIGDQFPHQDSNVPGYVTDGLTNPISNLDVRAYTQTVGSLEAMGGLEARDRGRGDGFRMAGLSYYANTEDLRPDLPGDQLVKTYIVDTQEYEPAAPILEENLLWLAAKYGGFNDLNGDKDPNDGNPDDPTDDSVGDSTAEWDADGDGIPDNYTLASQPANLIRGLNNHFGQIAAVIGAGSAAGVVSNTISSEGLVIQALFKPSLSDSFGNNFSWGGIVHSLFVDEFENLREDSDGDGVLSDADAVITYFNNTSLNKVQVQRMSTSDGGQSLAPYNGSLGLLPIDDVEQIQSVWNARDALSDLQNTSGQLRLQRSYSSVVSNGNASRYIRTAIDVDRDGLVVPAAGADTALDFTAANFPSPGSSAASNLQNNFRLLGLSTTTGGKSADIVNFVRGEEVTGMRSRKVDYDGDGVEEVWRLGDVVSSSPLVAGPPVLTERYDLIYEDDTYGKFYEKYRNRRQMVYVGANDGMIHGFNAGFFDGKKFVTQRTGETAHPLGAELWAYVPYNLLPHLKWTTEFNYQHVFFVDGEAQTFDVNIFADDADHPKGWGTILVMGMRFGGGEYVLDPDSDADADVTDDITLRSAYVVLDVTNPESPPKLLAEISHPNMGYTMSRPTVIKARKPTAGTSNFAGIPINGDEWLLVMGSGPVGTSSAGKSDALNRALSEQKSKLFFFDLQSKNLMNFNGQQYLEVPDVNDGFTGDLIAVDWDRDFVDDVIYFGTVTNDTADPTGDFWRLPLGTASNFVGGLSQGSFSRTIERSGGSLGLPVSGQAYAYKYRGKHWVAFGTGRFYVDDDSKSQKQMSFFGFKEPVDASGDFTWASLDLSTSDMVDTTDIQPQFIVNTVGDPWDGKIFDASSGADSFSINGSNINNYVDFRETLHQQEPGGWYFNFKSNTAKQIGRVIGDGPVILFSEYLSDADACAPAGTSNISQLYLGTGHAAPFFALNKKVTLYGEQVQDRYILGGEAIVGKVKELSKSPEGAAVGQSSTGEILQPIELDTLLFKSGFVSWREIPVNWK